MYDNYTRRVNNCFTLSMLHIEQGIIRKFFSGGETITSTSGPMLWVSLPLMHSMKKELLLIIHLHEL